MMADQEKEFLQKLQATFRSEAQEHLQEISSNIVMLEQANPAAQKDFVQHILKKLHTLKGAARAVNLMEMEALCHAMESVFSAVMKHEHIVTAEEFDLMHQTVEVAQSLLRENSGRLRNRARSMATRLDQLSRTILPSDKTSNDSAAPSPAPASLPAPGPSEAEMSRAGFTEPDETGEQEDTPSFAENVQASEPDDVIRVHSKSLDAIRHQVEGLLSLELSLQHHINDLLSLADTIVEHEASHSASEPGRQLKLPATQRARKSGLARSPLETRCRRLAGELAKTRRNFLSMRAKLMDATLETALVPFGSALEPLPALVRNLARNQGKEASLQVEGAGTQIDRRVLDIIREALIHLVTNAVDHGIESIEARLAKAKPSSGTVRISVLQSSSNQIAVTVADDGAGMDVEALVASAARNAELRPEKINAFSEQQKLQLALRSGISTRQEVTHVSGRGVGLAIVAEKVASVGGELLIENTDGAGCVFRLMLPVRLATMRGLLVNVQGSRYVVPLSEIESVRALKPGDIQTVESQETLLVGKRVIPAIRLVNLLGINQSENPPSGIPGIALIIRYAGNYFSLLVNEVHGEQEVLPKSLGKQLRRVRYLTGATQLGDGALVPILGMEDIAKYGLLAPGTVTVSSQEGTEGSNKKRVLVAEDSITSRLLLKHILESAGYQVETAIDGLEALSRLRQEEFDIVVSDVEMPRLDGLGLTQQLRANPKTADMPVVLVTSLHAAEEKERGLQAGADAYVVKGSFDQDNLLATVRRLI